MKQFNTIIDFLNYFKNENICRKYLKKIRFRNGEFCPYCHHRKIYSFSDGIRYKCAQCRKIFTLKVGTIFESSRISLKKWFLAIYLLSTGKKGISSIQLGRQVGVTQKTAWFMYHRIRNTYTQKKSILSGTVEIDETYIGGKNKNRHKNKKIKNSQGRSTKVKTPVFGLANREGKFKAQKVEKINKKTIKEIIKKNVKNGSLLYSDEYNIYKKVTHKRVNHSNGEYVRGAVHTNTIESFWALFKRGYIGIYHYMSRKHLQRFINEFIYRINNKLLSNFDIVKKALLNVEGHLSYKELING